METSQETSERKSIFWNGQRARWCNWVGALVGAVLLAPLGIILFDRREPITLHGGTMVPEIVRPGQTVTITWNVTENRNCNGEFARRVVDASGKIHEFKREATVYHLMGSKAGKQTFSKEFTLPEGLAEGPAYYSTSGERWCNVLQKYLWPIPFDGPRITFAVVNPPRVTPIPAPELKRLEEKLDSIKKLHRIK